MPLRDGGAEVDLLALAMANEHFRIHYVMTRDDYVAMSAALLAPSLRSRLIRVAAFLVIALVFLFIAGRGYEDFERFWIVISSRMPWWFYLLFPAVALLMLVSHRLIWLTARSFYRKIAAAEKEVTMTVDASGIEAQSPDLKSNIGWSAIQRVIPVRDHVFLAISKREALIVPRRGFASDAEFAAFLPFVARHVPAGTPMK